MFKLLRSRLLLLLSLLILTIGGVSSTIPSTHAASGSVLILSTTVTNGTNSLEAQAAKALGLSVNVVDPSTWANMTTANFASYKAIILGDPTCVADTSPLAPAEANTSTWGSAIKGNVVVIGTDPVFHATYGSQSGAQTLISNGIAFATSTSGKTGAYIDLSCYYAGASSGTSVPVLNGIASSGFTVVGQYSSSTGCPDNSHIVGTSPVLTGLTDASLSNWGCSTHEGFVTWPSNFQVQVISEDIPSSFVAPDGTTGAPYILTRGSSQGITPPPQQSIPPAQIPSSGYIGFLFHQRIVSPFDCVPDNDPNVTNPAVSHQGIDIWTHTDGTGTDSSSPKGNPVLAPYDGTVIGIFDANDGVAIGPGGGPSKTASILVISHGLIGGQQIYTLYAHMANADGSETYIDQGLHNGAKVTKGQRLGYQGNATGTASPNTQLNGHYITHLHFEVKTTPKIGGEIDPSPYLGRQVDMCNPGHPGFLDAFP